VSVSTAFLRPHFQPAMNVLLFASYADAFGGRRVTVPVSTPCTVAALVDALRTLPGGSRLPERPLVAVNRSWAAHDVTVNTGDEVAVIPPVAGG
jgi:molybdopterin synthase sulfur carrier subunit